MTNLESEFTERYIKTLTTWILYHRLVIEFSTISCDMNYYDTEGLLVKLNVPSVLKVVKHLYETDRAGLDKLYEQGVDEIEHLKELIGEN